MQKFIMDLIRLNDAEWAAKSLLDIPSKRYHLDLDEVIALIDILARNPQDGPWHAKFILGDAKYEGWSYYLFGGVSQRLEIVAQGALESAPPAWVKAMYCPF